MKKLILLLAICFASCSKDEPVNTCHQIIDKKKVYDNGYVYYLDLYDYGLKEVSKTEYDQYKISQEYCLGLKY